MCYPQDGVAALSFLDYGTEILNSDHLIASLDFGSITSSGKFLGWRCDVSNSGGFPVHVTRHLRWLN